MNLRMIGTGSIFSKRFNACALLDKKILVDLPGGAVKKIKDYGEDLNKLEIIILTHFHGDHYFDFPFLLLELGLSKDYKKQLNIIIPKGDKDKLKKLFLMGYKESLYDKLVKKLNLNILEVKPNEKLELNGYEIKTYDINHSSTVKSIGYTIDNKKEVIGFTGDTNLNEGVYKIIKESDKIVIDTNFNESNKSHLGINDVIRFSKENKKCKFIATHISDEVSTKNDKYLIIPKDGEMIK